MPRQNREVPYVRRDRDGRTLYYRQIPGRLRPHFDNRRTWNRALPGNPGAAAWHQAYAAAHSEFEDLLRAAKAASGEHCPQRDQVAARTERQSRMRQRDIAAVAADPLRKMLRRIRGGDVEAEFHGLEPLAGKLFGLIGILIGRGWAQKSGLSGSRETTRSKCSSYWLC
ncbi:phage integrase family protein [Synechococcus sp. A18-46.1]|nr:phage integrase family protein [Synechococcus sp. A18-46.1]